MQKRNKTQTPTPKEAFLAANQRDGEAYGGILLGKNGKPDVHVFLLPGDTDPLNWDAAKKWAEEQGGDLPTCSEQALLSANLKEEFRPYAYWSCELHDSDSRWAWYQRFLTGSQDYSTRSLELRARAVRRLVIE